MTNCISVKVGNQECIFAASNNDENAIETKRIKVKSNQAGCFARLFAKLFYENSADDPSNMVSNNNIK